MNQTNPRRDGCNAHKAPKLGGKDFRAKDHMEEFEKLGLVTTPPQLARGDDPDFRPGGQPRREGGKMIYPHFG